MAAVEVKSLRLARRDAAVRAKEEADVRRSPSTTGVEAEIGPGEAAGIPPGH
jgi:hypothetical protein